MLIYALVAAATEEDALVAGKCVFDRLVGVVPDAGAVFDYYVTFDEKDSRVSGRARWGALPVAAPIARPDGRALLDRGWAATEAEFTRNLDRVRQGIERLSDEELMRDTDLVRHACHQVGAYDGPSIFLYDQHGWGIRHREQLDRVLAAYADPWIVPADVHF
jgi:hypothetical protein